MVLIHCFFASFAVLLPLLPGSQAAARTIGEKAVQNHIRPAYAELEKAAAHLQAETQAYCRGMKGRDAFEEAFRGAVIAWAGVEHIRFGPIAEDNRYERMAFWPDPKGIGLKQINAALRARNQALTDSDTLKGKSVALQGLTALELLFWGEDVKLLWAKAADRDFLCAYAQAITANVAGIAAAAAAGWRAEDGFAALLQAPQPGRVYESDKEVTLELFKAFRTGLQQTRDIKLARVLMGGPHEARPSRAAFWRSGNAAAIIAANMRALHDLFERAGLAELIAHSAADAQQAVREEFRIIDETLHKLRAVPMETIARDKALWTQAHGLVFSLVNIQMTGANAIVKAAALPMSFNALDGD